MIPFFILIAFSSLASALTVNTPMAAVVCHGSPPPFFLSLIPGGRPTDGALKQFPPQQGTSYTWDNVSLAVGTSFTAALKDAKGQQAYSAPVTVQSGSDTSCVNDQVIEGNKEASGPASPSNSSPAPGIAAVDHNANAGTSSSPVAASPSTSAPSAAESTSAKSSQTAKSPNGSALASPAIKANSVGREVSSGAVVGMMVAVGLTSVWFLG
ncbi:hypothetical protein F5148DRAFT_123394 [Russula earlei]|uniref:Uncharacterized protein n=1 Tax=Russula earlei TaxID=71964 RepID=A0ACC0UKF1_9AGAM|nr:hypothetical protein F5148DRAFT_123394 [Russula earlei]